MSAGRRTNEHVNCRGALRLPGYFKHFYTKAEID